MSSINNQTPMTGKMIRDNKSIVNVADMLYTNDELIGTAAERDAYPTAALRKNRDMWTLTDGVKVIRYNTWNGLIWLD